MLLDARQQLKTQISVTLEKDEFFGGYNIYHKAECYGENLKTFYIGNTNIMNEGEKRKILKKYNPDVLPIEVVKGIYEETEELDTLTNMSNVDIQIWLEGDIYFNIDICIVV